MVAESESVSLKKVDFALKSSSSGSEREVLDCAAEWLEYMAEDGEEECWIAETVVGRSGDGGTWHWQGLCTCLRQRKDIEIAMAGILGRGRPSMPLPLPVTLTERVPLGELPPPPSAIVVTVPSSPDDSPKARQRAIRTPPLRALELCAPSDITSRAPFHSTNLSPSPTMSQSASMSPFEERLATSDLPPPGAQHFAARRALWWTPGSNPPSATEPNPSRRRLEALLSQPGALEDDQVWDTGVDRVWRGLLGGAKLKHRLPLALVVCHP